MIYRGDIIDNTYLVCNEIGAGGMGVVYQAVHMRLNKTVVMKRLKNANASLAMMRNEVDVLKSLKHTYLPQVYDFIEYDGDLFTIIDYIEGYDLKYYIDNDIAVSEGQLIKWLKQLCEVLIYLHHHQPRILHLDIKPANIIIQTNGDICLIDFGISALGNDEMLGISYDYCSPEQYYNACCMDQGRYDQLIELDERTDIYSLGATFYQLITGIKPSCQYVLEPSFPYIRIPVSHPLTRIIDIAVSYDRESRYADASKMLKAIEGMFKFSSKYKQYLLIQTACSSVACLLIFLGAYLIYGGIYNNIKASFEADYNAYIAALNSKDMAAVSSSAKKLINDSNYRSMMEGETGAEVYHGLGDAYYEKGDFVNAAECYAKAVEFASDSDQGDLYYRDYAIALIELERYTDAKDVLMTLQQRYPDSASGYLISAHMAYKTGDTKQALSLAKNAAALSADSDSRYNAYLLIGVIQAGEGNLASSVDAYRQAISAKETALALRKLGSAQMKLAAAENKKQYYDDALASFQKIYDDYAPTDDDIFNLAQCRLLSSDPQGPQNCIKLMEEYVATDPDSCRSYILMAIAADAIGDSRAADYARTAHNLYLLMSDSERAEIDKESITQIKKIYKRYCEGEW